MRKSYTPRGYATSVWTHMAATPRAGLGLGMGLGKSSLVLFHLSAMALSQGRVPRTLVIGPKRVALNVWTAECALWQGLEDLRTSVIIGTPEERIRALKKDADIYTINYENIPWLVAQLDGAWPFECVVCDESTKLAGFRGGWSKHHKTGKVFYRRGGTQRAAELGGVAHKSKYWVQLSGSMASGGIEKVWGQQWFLDYGKALGGTYTAFTDRWFRQRIGTSKEAAVFEPWDGAVDEILVRIKPHWIVLDAYKYFEIDKPNYVHVPVHLDKKQAAEYKTLHDVSLLQLSAETTITAVNAGAKINKCLQYASGVLLDEDGTQHHIHDHKLDALDSIVEELGGEPLLVAYWYKHDAERIKKRFPQAVQLDDKKETEDKWNRGEIPMLLVHPMSAGHGLSLQHGGHNLCIYTPMHSLELFEQLVERLGPVRQKQSGYDRVCNVYLLEAKGTWDEKVWKRLVEKKSLDEMIKEALQLP